MLILHLFCFFIQHILMLEILAEQIYIKLTNNMYIFHKTKTF